MTAIHKPENFEVGIIGAGPAGLMLANLLTDKGISCRVFEKNHRFEPEDHAVVLHQPLIKILSGHTDYKEIIDHAIPITGLEIRHYDHRLQRVETKNHPDTRSVSSHASISFERFLNFLRNRIEDQNSNIILNGCSLEGLTQDEDKISISCQDTEGRIRKTEFAYLAGCDGRTSAVRGLSDIPFLGGPYRDTFATALFKDEMEWGSDCMVFFHPDGIIESVPCPAGRRQWTIRNKSFYRNLSGLEFVHRVRERTGISLNPGACSPIRSYGTQHYLAARAIHSRVCLAGDSAHLLSLLGGGGMNAGCLDAFDLASALEGILRRNKDPGMELSRYDRNVKARVRIHARRAAMHLFFGRKTQFPGLKKALIRMMIRSSPNRCIPG